MSNRKSPTGKGNADIYGIPAILAVVSGIGLAAALVWDGFMDYFSALAIAVPLFAAAWRIGSSRARAR